MLASRMNRSFQLRSHNPLSDDQIRQVAPSIFAENAHASRSDRYTYIPTISVLDALRKEGFQPFFAAQTRVRDESKREHTKHMLRLRHGDKITTDEANEIILLNSHDGTSSYQMLAGMFRFVCCNGMVAGEVQNDIRVRHNGDVIGEVIDGAFRILDTFETIENQRDGMRALTLNAGEQDAFARAALMLKYDEQEGPAPITETQVLRSRRFEDGKDDMWTVLNRVQENMIQGGLVGRNRSGQRTRTRPVQGIDQNVKLNRALWTLAEEMRKLKA